MEQGIEGALRTVMGLVGKVLGQGGNAGWNSDSSHEYDAAIFSYQRDFSHLWGLNSGGQGLEAVARRLIASLNGEALTLVVIWDEIPAGDTRAVNTSRYITPLDWAVALSLFIHRLSKEQTAYPALRIIIVDPASHRTDYADCLGLLSHLQLVMPWIALCQPVTRVPGTKGIDRFFLDTIDIQGKLASGIPTMHHAVGDGHAHPELIRKIWALFLSKPSTQDDHHAIANLLGPQLLLGETTRADVTVQAIRCVMLATGLLPEVLTLEGLLTTEEPWIKIIADSTWRLIKQRTGGRIKLLLVDDQWEDGWGEVLCKAIGLEFDDTVKPSNDKAFVKISKSPTTAGVSVHAANSASKVLDSLPLKNSCEDRRFKLSLDDSEPCPDAAEILFLDLRLFSGKSSAEVDFIARCHSIAQKMTAERKDQLPWPPFSDDQPNCDDNPSPKDKPNSVRSWLTEARQPGAIDPRELPGYAECLSLFARILAQLDLALPIVIFSSTGRRDIVKHFKGYDSIICEMDKPRMTGGILNNDIAAQAKYMFKTVMSKTAKLLSGKIAVREIEKIAKLAGNPPQSHYQGPLEINVFIDESGDDFIDGDEFYFVIGGFVLIHDSTKTPGSLNTAMGNTSVTISGRNYKLAWCGPDKLPKRISSDADKEAEITKISLMKGISQAVTNNSLIAIPVSLQVRIDRTVIDAVNVLNNQHLDNLYLRATKELLDIIIYELVPWHIGNRSDITYKIFAGTRDRLKNRNKDAFTSTEINDLRENFGIEITGDKKDRYKALSPTSFIPIVANTIIDRCANQKIKFAVKAAKGVTLDYYSTTCAKNVQHAHYLADFIVHFDFTSIGYPNRDVFDVFNYRIRDLYDEGFKAALEASKYMDVKDKIFTLLSAFKATLHYDSAAYPLSVIPKILYRVIQDTRELTGKEFIVFAEAVPVPPSGQLTGVVVDACQPLHHGGWLFKYNNESVFIAPKEIQNFKAFYSQEIIPGMNLIVDIFLQNGRRYGKDILVKAIPPEEPSSEPSSTAETILEETVPTETLDSLEIFKITLSELESNFGEQVKKAKKGDTTADAEFRNTLQSQLGDEIFKKISKIEPEKSKNSKAKIVLHTTDKQAVMEKCKDASKQTFLWGNVIAF